MKAILFTVLALTAACQKDKPVPPPVPPTAAQIEAMNYYCMIGDMPEDKRKDALKMWGWNNGGSPEMGPLWSRAARDKNPQAIATVFAAAEAARGKGNCPILEPLRTLK